MTMDELAAHDAAERIRLRTKAIADVERAIEMRRGLHAPTDALERQLVSLRQG